MLRYKVVIDINFYFNVLMITYYTSRTPGCLTNMVGSPFLVNAFAL